MSTASHIAIVDDEPEIRQLLANYLGGHGYRVTALASGEPLFALMERDAAGLVLLDLGLPGEDGLSIARRLRERWRCGLVIVTGRGDAVDKVVGLEFGADDYVTKPFDMRELLARIKAVLRRMEPVQIESAPAVVRFEGWKVDLQRRQVWRPDETEVPLTAGEFDLLAAFLEHPGRVLSRDFLLNETRGRDAGPFDRTIDVQVGRLRKKIDDDANDPRIIKSVRAAGYIFVPSVTRR